MIKKEVFIIASLVSIVFLIFAYGRMGSVEIDEAVFLVTIALSLLYLARTVEVELKYASPKFVSEPVHSTCNFQDIRLVGNYAVIKLGGFNAMGFHYAGGDEGTAIITRDGLSKIGESCVAKVKVREISLDECPPIVRDMAKELNIKTPIYYGIVGTSKELTEPKIEKIIMELQERNATCNMLKDLIADKNDIVERAVASAGRISERRKGFSAVLGDIFKLDEKDKHE